MNQFGSGKKTDIKAEKYIMESTKFDSVVESISKCGSHLHRRREATPVPILM